MLKHRQIRASLMAITGSMFLAGLALAQSDDAVPASDTTVSYGDWSQHCMLVQIQKEGDAEPGKPQRICEVTQTLNAQQKDGQTQRLLTIAVGKLPATDNYRAVVQTPANVDLRTGVTMSLGDSSIDEPTKGDAVTAMPKPNDISLTYVTCGQFCTADIALSDAQLMELKKTDSAAVTFKMMNGKALKVPLSMKGFKAALTAAPPVN
ncbi:invasion associated locus B family protein [Martelella alba]|nr:invasion associated locus B family protein [Martelella alba]